MSTTERVAEAEQATIAYQIALTALSAKVIAEAVSIWLRMVPINGGTPTTNLAWRRETGRMVRRSRKDARALARSYYRLSRALTTGTTVAPPSDTRSTVRLNDLRTEFGTLAGPKAPAPKEDNPLITVEPLSNMDEDAADIDREADAEIDEALENLGSSNFAKKLAAISPKADPDEAEREREAAHQQAGARQAAAAQRIASNGARSELWTNTSKDRRALGYIRLSRSGTPCGWCAMLISRGPVYKSEQSGGGDGYDDGDKYHDNCNCYAVPVFTKLDWETNPLYALNREYAEMWPKVTRGLSGEAPLTAWRRYIRTTQKRPQAGRTTTTAQEA